MSQAAATAFIKKHIDTFGEPLVNILNANYRDLLSKRISILDISPSSLSVNMEKENTSIDFTSTYSIFYKLIKNKMVGNTYKSLEEAVKVLGRDRLLFTPIFIDSSTDHKFLVGSTYRNLRDIISNITSSTELSDSIFGTYQEYQSKGNKWTDKSNLDLGHVPSKGNDNLTSPLEEQLHDIYLHYKDSPEIANQVKKSLEELYSIQADFSYSFRNTAPESIASARSILGEGYVVLTLHTHAKNLEFAKNELALYNKLLYNIASTIDILNMPGSNSISEDIVAAMVASLSSKSGPKTHKVTKSKVSSNTSKGKTSVDINKGKFKLPQLRNNNGRFYSLANLLVLLNSRIDETVSSNMGEGWETKILNYRTGRFASSVKVERLSQSREGMISAFYSYMKYPYQTFEPGFKQGHPASRNPKLLIAKSIREIAETVVKNKMRSVSI